jgi:hypothetical protein
MLASLGRSMTRTAPDSDTVLLIAILERGMPGYDVQQPAR